MLDTLITKLKSLMVTQPPLDPARFNDPLALATEWTPAKPGGANFRTHRLIMPHPGRAEFVATAGAKVFYGLFTLIGCALFLFAGIKLLTTAGPTRASLIAPLVIGALFALVGIIIWRQGNSPIVFDGQQGLFWQGKREESLVYDSTLSTNATRFDNIHALQLVAEHVRGSKSSYYSYELNLVLKDASRVNVVDHGNPATLREDAAELARFLNRPLWDGVEG
jgi:hypothetical protein